MSAVTSLLGRQPITIQSVITDTEGPQRASYADVSKKTLKVKREEDVKSDVAVKGNQM